MALKNSVYGESISFAFYKTLSIPFLRPAFSKGVTSIMYNFFIRQHTAALIKRIPISKVDHPLDEIIPFNPSWITIYHDFSAFWVRTLSFFLKHYGRKSYKVSSDFIISIGKLYALAADVYRRNLSTTKRPFYISRPQFLIIHLLDPHLMCIPSLHVMVVIHTFKSFALMSKSLGTEKELMPQYEELKQGALAITRSILFVKQHSINCIAASLYAMTCFSPDVFTDDDVQDFVDQLFCPAPDPTTCPSGDARLLANYKVHPSASPDINISKEDQEKIKAHIFNLYRKFASENPGSQNWYDPLLNYLQNQPRH